MPENYYLFLNRIDGNAERARYSAIHKFISCRAKP